MRGVAKPPTTRRKPRFIEHSGEDVRIIIDIMRHHLCNVINDLADLGVIITLVRTETHR